MACIAMRCNILNIIPIKLAKYVATQTHVAIYITLQMTMCKLYHRYIASVTGLETSVIDASTVLCYTNF